MDTVNPAPGEGADTARPETEVERRRRVALGAEGLVRARASIAAGYYATSAEVNAWIDSLGGDNTLPVPYPRHPGSDQRGNPRRVTQQAVAFISMAQAVLGRLRT
jgi:hypothetical protein